MYIHFFLVYILRNTQTGQLYYSPGLVPTSTKSIHIHETISKWACINSGSCVRKQGVGLRTLQVLKAQVHIYNQVMQSLTVVSQLSWFSTEAGNVTDPNCMTLDKSFSLCLFQYFFFNKMEKKKYLLHRVVMS